MGDDSNSNINITKTESEQSLYPQYKFKNHHCQKQRYLKSVAPDLFLNKQLNTLNVG